MTPTPGRDHYSKAVEFLKLEAAAIDRVAQLIDGESVQKAVDLLLNCTGKVIVVGVGKSGVIAQKIAQTMTSTGTVAVFVHPSDALHGGLGVISNDDVAIVLSNSGETDELLTIMPSLRTRAASLIAIVGNTNSSLARQASVFLDASVDQEACPLNLAPTTSTTVALAIGDALAMAVMDAKGLTAEEFAANHPAGQLGKRLTLKVADLMHTGASVSPSAGWLDVVHAISLHTLGAVNVIDDDSTLLGIVTDGDLRRTIERTDPNSLGALSAEAMMTRSPVTATADMLAYDALRLMEDRPSQISVLPVVDSESRSVGLIRLHDIIRSGL